MMQKRIGIPNSPPIILTFSKAYKFRGLQIKFACFKASVFVYFEESLRRIKLATF